MDTRQVREHFRAQTSEYPDLMRRLIPGYEEHPDLALKLIPFSQNQPIAVLDLGCGPGLVASRILAHFPQAHVLAVDFTQEMLDVCRTTVRDTSRVTLRLADFRTDDLGSGHDVVTAMLSLHHMPVAERPGFYRRLHASMNEGGVLIASEVIVDESPTVREDQYRLWRDFMTTNGEDGTQWYDRHDAKDHPATISSLLSMLSDAGFEAGCYWRRLNFAIISARKSRR